jgi:hypothetical protein
MAQSLCSITWRCKMKKIVVFLIIITLFWASKSLAGEPKVFSDTDLKKYGSSDESSGDSNHCSVVDYDSYANTYSMPQSGYIYDSNGHISISGGGQVKGPTYLKVEIKNNSAQERTVYTSRDIKVYTIKGNVISPKNSETYQIKPGETITISGLKLGLISKIESVECSCW